MAGRADWLAVSRSDLLRIYPRILMLASCQHRMGAGFWEEGSATSRPTSGHSPGIGAPDGCRITDELVGRESSAHRHYHAGDHGTE